MAEMMYPKQIKGKASALVAQNFSSLHFSGER